LKWTNGVIGHERMSGVLAKLQLNRWYTLETEITLNSCFSCNDGVGRLWLDGVLLDEFTGFSWSNPAWQGVQDPSKQYWDIFLIGDQVSYEQGAFNEYRYWDNVTMARRASGRAPRPARPSPLHQLHQRAPRASFASQSPKPFSFSPFSTITTE
jgi:hypothetical protein